MDAANDSRRVAQLLAMGDVEEAALTDARAERHRPARPLRPVGGDDRAELGRLGVLDERFPDHGEEGRHGGEHRERIPVRPDVASVGIGLVQRVDRQRVGRRSQQPSLRRPPPLEQLHDPAVVPVAIGEVALVGEQPVDVRRAAERRLPTGRHVRGLEQDVVLLEVVGAAVGQHLRVAGDEALEVLDASFGLGDPRVVGDGCVRGRTRLRRLPPAQVPRFRVQREQLSQDGAARARQPDDEDDVVELFVVDLGRLGVPRLDLQPRDEVGDDVPVERRPSELSQSAFVVDGLQQALERRLEVARPEVREAGPPNRLVEVRLARARHAGFTAPGNRASMVRRMPSRQFTVQRPMSDSRRVLSDAKNSNASASSRYVGVIPDISPR